MLGYEHRDGKLQGTEQQIICAFSKGTDAALKKMFPIWKDIGETASGSLDHCLLTPTPLDTVTKVEAVQ